MNTMELDTPPTADALRPIDLALADFLQRQFPTASAAHCRLAALVSQQLASGHLCVLIHSTEFVEQVQRVCGAPLASLLNDNPLIRAGGKSPLVLDEGRLYLHRYWQLEVAIAAHLDKRLQENLLEASAVKTPLQILFPVTDETPDWQQLACLLAGRKAVGIITGGPGTGKTTTVVKLLALLHQQALDHGQSFVTLLAAPTGKAAARLQTSINKSLESLPISAALRATLPTQVKTLHRLLGSQMHSRHFKHDRHHPLTADLVVVDEASMIDIDMMLALLEALPAHCRLILVGDKDQLASVEAGAIMADLCQGAEASAYSADTLSFIHAATGQHLPTTTQPSSPLAQQTILLRKNWRSRNAPGINALAQAINQQDATAANRAFAEHPQQLSRTPRDHDWIRRELIGGENGIAELFTQMHKERPDKEAAAPVIDAWAKRLLERLERQQLLTPLRHGQDGIEGLNAAIAQQLQRAGLIKQPDGFPGQPLLITRNLYDLQLMNGDLGLLLDHPQLGRYVAFMGEQGIRWVSHEQLLDRCQTAFALSVHQSQGSEFARVLLYLPDNAPTLLTKELLYTAVTRARETFVLLDGVAGSFEAAIQRKTERHSGLAQRLHQV